MAISTPQQRCKISGWDDNFVNDEDLVEIFRIWPRGLQKLTLKKAQAKWYPEAGTLEAAIKIGY